MYTHIIFIISFYQRLPFLVLIPHSVTLAYRYELFLIFTDFWGNEDVDFQLIIGLGGQRLRDIDLKEITQPIGKQAGSPLPNLPNLPQKAIKQISKSDSSKSLIIPSSAHQKPNKYKVISLGLRCLALNVGSQKYK